MPINTLEYSKLMMKKLDQHIIQTSKSGWMEENAGQVIYNGGDEVKIPNLSTVGLANYDRDNGFVQGGVTLKYDTYKMTQDRGRTFQLDAMDVNETNFILSSASVMKEFQTRHVVPEIDSYRFSKLATKCVEKSRSEEITLTADNALTKLREHIRAIEDITGQNGGLIINIPLAILALIEDSPKVGKSINVADFKQGNLSFKVKTIDDHFINVVPSARFKSKYKVNDGTSSGQEQGGLVADESAKDINWIICPRNLPLAISKTDKLRVFTPDENQKADAWKIDYRKYHDLWILANRTDEIFTCLKNA